MSAVAVVREKETGSIANFRSTPITKFEFLFGKQLPYIGIALVNFILLALQAFFMFGVPIKGSLPALGLGTILYVIATTGFGQLISSFVRTQVAAVFATAILAIVPAVNFSGLFKPVSVIAGGSKYFGQAFPSAWYNSVSVGAFAKALGFADLWIDLVVLLGFGILYLIASQALLRKQEA